MRRGRENEVKKRGREGWRNLSKEEVREEINWRKRGIERERGIEEY
jgi:hypothetical protein